MWLDYAEHNIMSFARKNPCDTFCTKDWHKPASSLVQRVCAGTEPHSLILSHSHRSTKTHQRGVSCDDTFNWAHDTGSRLCRKEMQEDKGNMTDWICAVEQAMNPNTDLYNFVSRSWGTIPKKNQFSCFVFTKLLLHAEQTCCRANAMSIALSQVLLVFFLWVRRVRSCETRINWSLFSISLTFNWYFPVNEKRKILFGDPCPCMSSSWFWTSICTNQWPARMFDPYISAVWFDQKAFSFERNNRESSDRSSRLSVCLWRNLGAECRF